MQTIPHILGDILCIMGGVCLIALVIGALFWLSGEVWIEASNKWRDIVRAESLIYEYRRNRDKFLRWMNEEGDANAEDKKEG